MTILTTETGFVKAGTIGDMCAVLRKVNNPNPDVSNADLDQLVFCPDRQKLSADLWNAIVQLYFEIARKHNAEVRVELYRQLNTNNWRVGVPKQNVNATACFNQDHTNVVDILTGERYNPEVDAEFSTWYQFGTSHSHGALQMSNFSSEDDAEELEKEGPHILISHINLTKGTYVATGSIVWNKKRKIVPIEELVDLETEPTLTFHPNCLEQVTHGYQTLNSKYAANYTGNWYLDYKGKKGKATNSRTAKTAYSSWSCYQGTSALSVEDRKKKENIESTLETMMYEFKELYEAIDNDLITPIGLGQLVTEIAKEMRAEAEYESQYQKVITTQPITRIDRKEMLSVEDFYGEIDDEEDLLGMFYSEY